MAPQTAGTSWGSMAHPRFRVAVSEARARGIYVHESPELVSLLMQVDLDQHIPPQLYRAVAELLAWLYKMETGMETKMEISALTRPKRL